MAPRANWKGYLRLSLVSCPIALYPASSLSEKVSFNRINRKTGNRLKQQNVDSETGEVVSRDDMVRGYEVAKGQYMIVEDEEIEAVQIESTRTIDIDRFVPKSEIDERYIDSPYYIAPDGAVGQEAFAVIRDTIAKLNMVALGRVVLARREHVIALEPKGRGLVGTTLRYPYEVREEKMFLQRQRSCWASPKFKIDLLFLGERLSRLLFDTTPGDGYAVRLVQLHDQTFILIETKPPVCRRCGFRISTGQHNDRERANGASKDIEQRGARSRSFERSHCERHHRASQCELAKA
jgi:Ku protein